MWLSKSLFMVRYGNVCIPGMLNEFLSHPMAKVWYPTGNNRGPLVKANGFVSHKQSEEVFSICMYVSECLVVAYQPPRLLAYKMPKALLVMKIKVLAGDMFIWCRLVQ